MAYTTIDKPTDYFNTVLYTGNGSSNAITGVGFQPDWIWLKNRSTNNSHQLYDAVRGTTKYIESDNTDSEYTSSDGISAFGTDGFTIAGNLTGANNSGGNFVSWNWLGANGTASNSNGSITSTVSANTTAGFSIVTWTGNGSDATIGHGLSSAPEMYVVKNRSDSADWRVGQTVAGNIMTGGNGYYMEWNDTKASTNPGSATTWGSTPTAPTASVFTVGSNNAHNGSSDSMVAYCFHSVKGYSKIGSYKGNGNADGTFVYTGFKPAWVMTKCASTSSTYTVWGMWDNKRNPFNASSNVLATDLNEAENGSTIGTTQPMDLLSNGFKARANSSIHNLSGETHLYMAFAESPFVTSTGIPNNAR